MVLGLAALLVGLGKSGMYGTGMIAVPLAAEAFGGKMSTGLLLPILALADLFAVLFYNRHASWKYIWALLPTTALGLLLGTWIGDEISDLLFKQMIGAMVLLSLVFMIWQERRSSALESNPWIAGFFGSLGGFSSMVGNAAGPVMGTYLLAMRLPKDNYIGTSAWFFLILNWVKLPLHIWSWKTITGDTLLLDICVIPLIMLGIAIGFRIIKFIPDKKYRYLVIAMTFISAIRLLM